jgi:hypothetical protein
VLLDRRGFYRPLPLCEILKCYASPRQRPHPHAPSSPGAVLGQAQAISRHFGSIPSKSGSDRKHFARELHKAEVAYEHELRAAAKAHAIADAALAKASALDCVALTTRQFIGGGDAPSLTIEATIAGRRSLPEARCKHCRHTATIDLSLVIWPRERQVHTIRLHCSECKRNSGRKRRPELMGLRPAGNPEPAAPSEAERKRR